MRKISTLLGVALLMSALSIPKAWCQYPDSGQLPLDPNTIPQFVDYLPHFAGLRVNAKAGGNLIVKAVKTQQVAVSTGTVLANGTVGTTPGAGLGNYFVYSISKDAGTTWTIPLWPSFTIEAKRGKQLNVEVRNELTGLTYKDVNIPADQTIMMSGVPLTGDPMTEPYSGPVPIAMHLHGGEVPSASDGGPYAWFTPGYALTGKGWNNGVTNTLTYPNTQEAATLWYHEHSQLGLTRINVYAGMAGFYFLRGPEEENDKLAGWSGDDFVQEATPVGKVADALHPTAYLPEIELAIQDRMFDTNGQLYYPVEPTNFDIHPFWSPEFFGDVITVNGKTWPYLSVAPRKYRFHILDGSNARFYNMWLQNLTTGAMGPSIVQVGTDGGMMDVPVILNPVLGQKLLLGCGERADVIIDFSKVAPGTVLTLMNDAAAPYPSGDPVTVGTTDRIMQFVVNGKMVDNKIATKLGSDKSAIPNVLRAKPMVKLTNFAGKVNITPNVTRQLTLNEVQGDGGPIKVLLNNSHFEEMPDMGMFGIPTEKPVEGTTELWQLINLTMDAHPMHMHLVQFQLVSRQYFNMQGYMDNYMNSFTTGINYGMTGMYMGGEGSPLLYDSVNADGAIGGNPAITPFLSGPVIPANPNEKGWKDVIINYPNQVTTYIVRFAPTDLPINFPKNKLIYNFDPSIGPGYAWHCHIVEHEDNDMMRPLNVQFNPLRLGTKPRLAPAQTNNEVAGFALEQNVPNPFSSVTEIKFQIPKNLHVKLRLFNTMGVEVKVLLDVNALAGNHTVVLYTDNLASGTYIYQLIAGDFISTKKLIINK
ncbi:MAG TPA: multicopper oxidase domain-containing protein [Paludibacter sp.]|nr:multicopper oxidase domain-containing protein [Paludibacter sp.]